MRTPSSAGEPEYTLRLDDAPVSYLLGGEKGGRAVADLYQLAVAGACCVADGAVAAALALTTSHVRSRQQFGRPLAAFQAVAQQVADVYIAARTLHLTALSACWPSWPRARTWASWSSRTPGWMTWSARLRCGRRCRWRAGR